MDMEKVRELTIDRERKRYDPILKPHSHLICLGCKKIVDIPKEFSPNIPEEFSRGYLLKRIARSSSMVSGQKCR